MLEGAARRARREGVANRVSLCLSIEAGWAIPGNYDALEIAGFDEKAMTVKCHNNRFADEVIQANQGAQQVARVA